MFDRPYPFDKCGRTSTMLADPVEKIYYRFKGKFRTYLVCFEVFASGIAAVKFCDIKRKNDGNRFDFVYDDGDAVRVIGTCLHIMLDFWKRSPAASFCFYGVPRTDTEQELVARFSHLDKERAAEAIDRLISVRYSIYARAMIDLFSLDYFRHLRDPAKYLYVLLNKRQPDPQTAMDKLADYLQTHYNLLFEGEES